MIEKTKRLNNIDYLKGIAIFLMVMGHALSWSYTDTIIRTPDNAFVRNLIYAFHMPLFFFLSGYVIDLKDRLWDFSTCRNIIFKRAISLALPCLSWYVISKFNDIPWFLRSLFLIIIIFTILKFIVRNIKSIWVELIVILFIGYIFLFLITRGTRGTELDYILNMTVVQIHYPYFVIGYFFRKKENSINLIKRNNIYTLAIILFCICFYSYNWNDHSHAVHALLRYILAFSGIAIVYSYSISIKTFNTKANNAVILMGKKSIEIYLLSNYFIIHSPDLFKIIISNNIYPGNIVAQILFGLLLSIPAILCCLFVVKIIDNSNILNLLLFGKK